MKRKLLSLLIVLLFFVGLLIGCSGDSVSESSPPLQNDETSIAPSVDSNLEERLEVTEFKLPIVEEKITFDVWIPGSPPATTRLEHEDDNIAIQAVEKLTNVHINRIRPGGANAQEAFNLSITSGDFPDSYITNPNFYIGGFDKYIDDNIIIDIAEYVECYPNYQNIRLTNDDTRRRTITDTGKVPGIYEIKQSVQPSFVGLVTREDLLKEFDIEKPRTYQEYHDLLVKFRDYGMTKPLLISFTGMEDGMMAGYGCAWSNYSGFIQVDGQVKFSPIEPGFKDYITMMRQWYSEGLIDPDFVSYQPGMPVGYGIDYANTASGNTGIWSALYTIIGVTEYNAADIAGFKLTTLTPPVKNLGDKRTMTIYNQSNTLISDGIETITSACENVEILLRYYDYFFTKEGSLFCDYGVEGVTYNMVDGKPVFTDLVLNDTEGYGSIYAIWGDYVYNGPKRWYDWERELMPTLPEASLNAAKDWDLNFSDEHTLPDVSVSIEDSATYSSILNDVTTYIYESVAKFIIGTTPLSEFDHFVETLKNMRIEEAIAIKQAAYDRYMAR